MKVFLLQKVSGVGDVGEVKEVADGYGRNFLIPRGLAEFASPALMKRAEEKRKALERRQLMVSADMEGLAQRLEGLEVNMKAKVGAQDRLYGAITSADIAMEVQRLTGQDIDKRKVELGEPIHRIGEYDIPVRLSRDLIPRLKVIVVEERVVSKVKDKVKAEPKREDKEEEATGEPEDKEEEAAEGESEVKD